MWRGYEMALTLYYNKCVCEWVRRGYNNTMRLKCLWDDVVMPPWLGDKAFHRSHQSNLLRKDARYYRKYFHGVPANLPYIWPVTKESQHVAVRSRVLLAT